MPRRTLAVAHVPGLSPVMPVHSADTMLWLRHTGHSILLCSKRSAACITAPAGMAQR